MKKIFLLSALWILTMTLFSQNAVQISGVVTDSITGLPLPAYPVTIQSDSSNGFFYYNVVYTNPNGIFQDSMVLINATNSGSVNVSVIDCQQYTHVVSLPYGPGNMSLIASFTICPANPPGCVAAFSYMPTSPQTLQFIDQSVGGNNLRMWDFGDGSISMLLNPIHTFPANGYYMVKLIIGAQGTTCWDSETMLILVDDSVPSGCQAYYTSQQDTVVPKLVHFTNQSVGNIGTFIWDFGDNTVDTIAYPGNPNVSHLYNIPGTYNACLTILSFDGLCSDYYCSSVTANFTQCYANYSYSQVPGTPSYVLQFADASVYQGSVTWLWNFGDGTSSTEQNPVHVFPTIPVIDPYIVCLTISTIDSSCSSTMCMQIIPFNQGCQAMFDAFSAPNAPLTMSFVDQSIGGIWQWIWDFGDGVSDTITLPNNPNISHTYQTPGFYNACLTIQGDFGLCNSTSCLTVAVYDSLPGCQAQFTYYPDSASSIPNVIRFVDLSLGYPTQWHWDFGDPASGILNTSTTQNPLHSFTAIGTYSVCLTIGGPGCQSVWCGTVLVGAGSDCINFFTFSQIGLSVNFQGHLLNNTGGVFLWNFGDDQTGTGQNIVHNYTWPGTYNVTLTTTTGPANLCIYSSSQIISVGDSVIWSQLYGQVFAGNFPLTEGMVFLFSLDTSGVYTPFVDISILDPLGIYVFSMVPQGNYVIYAIPFTNGYIPTYYGNSLNWQNASVVQLGTPNNPYNINLIQSNGYSAGTGSIGGQITQGDFSGSLIDKVTMLLKDEFGNTILYSQVDPSGVFGFSQLAYGTYYLRPEMAGCETQPMKIVISETVTNSHIMLTMSGNSILGRDDKQISLDAGVVYPNPVKQDAQITVRLTSASDLLVELYNMTGQLVYTNTESLNVDETIVLIPASQLNDGIYLLKIYTADGLMLTRKLLKSK